MGCIENLSMSGMMLRTGMDLKVGSGIGCEFSLAGDAAIDLSAVVVNRVGDLYGVRFEPGPISRILINDAIALSLSDGHASILSTHETGSGKIMRIVGGLNGSLNNDVMYSLTKVGVEELDVSGVTAVDQAGLALCLLAQGRYGVRIGQQSECFSRAWRETLRAQGQLDAGL